MYSHYTEVYISLDRFKVFADYETYMKSQGRVDQLYMVREELALDICHILCNGPVYTDINICFAESQGMDQESNQKYRLLWQVL